MTLVSTKETQKLFLTTNTKVNSLSRKIDIIVSPEFYWVRRFEIPVKTETQARHVLPTLFEDILDNTLLLSYQVIKLEENLFLCFAYNNKKIYEAIKNANISTANVNNLYFAQNECEGFNSFEIDEQKYMYTKEKILVKVPNNLLQDVISLDKVINNINLSSHKLQIKLYNDFISSKLYYSLFIIFGVLILMNALKYISFSSEIDDLEEKTLKVKSVNNLPSSMIQTNSILNKYDLQIKEEKIKREAVSYIISNRKYDLKSLSIKNNIINLEYLSVNKSDVDKFLSKKYEIISSKMDSFTLKVRIKI